MRQIGMLLAAVLSLSNATFAAESQAPSSAPELQTPSDYILLTVVLRHDQSRTLDDINKHLDA